MTDKRIKVAYCFYGQPRLIHRGYRNVNALIERFDKTHTFDFFFHVWYDPQLVGQCYTSSNYRNIPKDELVIQNNTMDELVKLYSPKKCEVECPHQFELPDEFANSNIMKRTTGKQIQNVNNTLSNLYSKYKTNEILNTYCAETGANYTLVISSRFDFLNTIDNIDLHAINPKKYTV